MRPIVVVLLALGLLAPVPGNGAPGDPPQSCQGIFATRGTCLVVNQPGYGSVTYSISGVAYGATDVAIHVSLRDGQSGRTLAACSAKATTSPVAEISCQQTVTLQAAPVLGECVAEGMVAGRFFCDALS